MNIQERVQSIHRSAVTRVDGSAVVIAFLDLMHAGNLALAQWIMLSTSPDSEPKQIS